MCRYSRVGFTGETEQEVHLEFSELIDVLTSPYLKEVQLANGLKSVDLNKQHNVNAQI
jgi:hypothetical protein